MLRHERHILGFTLIELMLVVLIIAILSLIAVPNFLEAQTRSKVARSQSDMRYVALGIEAYINDYNAEPIGAAEGMALLAWGETEKDNAYIALTTPVAYITKPPADPFAVEDYFKAPVYATARRVVKDVDGQVTCRGCPEASKRGFLWTLRSRGPGGTKTTDFHPSVDAPEVLGAIDPAILLYVYDPTNGVTSRGWLIRTNKGQYSGVGGN